MTAGALMCLCHAMAEQADTLRVVDVEEVSVVATPKENKKLRQLPVASTLLNQQQMQAQGVNNVKGLTAVVPNLFIPDYGSRLTSAVYIRGIGSRINTPSVGLYVDNTPYINQSAFDFSYADVERIDVLRGPQATLYGRNAMGGLIKVHTKSPFSYQGTDLSLGASTHNGYNTSVTHYHRVSPHFAFSTGGFYNYSGGFYKNQYNGSRMGENQQAGGRFRGILLPADNWKIDLNLSYEYSDQNGYPYFYMGAIGEDDQPEGLKDYIGAIAHNEASSYYRNLLNAGLNLEYQADHFILSSVTGYQWLKDRMALDQDFTPENIFNIEQRQKMHTLSEEIVLKSKPGQRWQWTTGAFGFYQWMKTDGPVNFHRTGIDNLIEGNVNRVFDGISAGNQRIPQMHLTINNDNIRIGGTFETPSYSGAIFHQSTINNLFVKGLSATIGLRLDYEHMSLDYASASAPTLFDFSLKMGNTPMVIENLKAETLFTGKERTDYLQLLPKFALQYEWKKGSNVYATISRGYRSGGYNVQMFNEVVQTGLRNAMMDALAAEFTSMSAMINKMKAPVSDIKELVTYKPEYTWNYEIGTHLNLFENRINLDAAVFMMDIRDQQLSKFSESGLGRVTVNAGRSRSLGAEVQLSAALCTVFTFNAGYGYTYSTFRDYITVNSKSEEVNYNGHYVPFVPKHTLNIGGDWHFKLNKGCWLDAIRFNANYHAAGRIYWTEANDIEASQAFYGTLNGRLSLQKGKGEINLWIRNVLDEDYATFYFESMGNRFMQKSNPTQAGIELRCRF